MSFECIRFSVTTIFLAVVLSHSTSTAVSQTSEPKTECWIGWIEAPNQHLRTVILLQRNQDGKAAAATMVSPDQSPVQVSLSPFQIDDNGEWRFTLENPADPKQSATYAGMQSSANRVVGDFEQLGTKLPLAMRKVDSLPSETSSLGADAVWLGSVDMVFRKMDYRLRVYSKPPFATNDSPKILFDSLSENWTGTPTQVSLEDGVTIFEMKSLGAKFVAKLNDAVNQLDGRFTKGALALPLTMTLQSDGVQATPSPSPSEEIEKMDRQLEQDEIKVIAQGSPLLLEAEATPAPQKSELVSTAFFDEIPFEVLVGTSKFRKAKQPNGAENGMKIAGTATIPKIAKDSKARRFPAVILVTGNGPQDRDETIGRHKPFQVLSHYLAENGIASLRYDDRGVGGSSGNFLNATSEEFAKDAIAVWAHAKSIPEIDAARIGILGHSEGAVIGSIAAVWEPGIAFLISLAPPGLTGSELLKTQIDRVSELQGMSDFDRKVTMDLQSKLQDIASGYFTDEETMRRDIQNAIKQNWDSLKVIAKRQDPNADLDQVRTELTNQIEGQFQQLRMPWYRFFFELRPSFQLDDDPMPNTSNLGKL